MMRPIFYIIQVDIRRLDVDKAYIQVTHAVPYFTEEELAAATRSTQFEKESQISRFVFETPFTLSGKAQGGVASQHMRKTILTSEEGDNLCNHVDFFNNSFSLVSIHCQKNTCN